MYQHQLELFQEHLDNTGNFSIYENIKSNEATRCSNMKWRNFYKNITSPHISAVKDTFLIGPYQLNPEAKRKNVNVLSVTALTFDIDESHGYSFEELVEKYSEYSGVIHTTWSHTTENPRYRLILSLTKPIPAENFKAVREAFLFINPELASICDKACVDISRAYYFFSYPQERSDIAQCCVLMGKPINPDEYNIPRTETSLMRGMTKSNIRQLETDSSAVREGQRNTRLAQMVGGYIGSGMNRNETLEASLDWNRFINPPLPENEVIQTHDNIWKTHLRNHPEETTKLIETTQPNESEFELIPASRLLATPPPQREWVIKDFLPKKIVASVIAAGGTGKSFLAMHIAVSVSSGSSLFGKYLPTSPSKVIFISGEDDANELKRRLHKVATNLPVNVNQNVEKNLHFIDLADSFELFTERSSKGEVSITKVPEKICSQIKAIVGDEVGLVIIDPISRFRGGEENLAADTTRFVQALQQIRDRLNTCVMTLHHVNKQSGGNGATQNNARGSSAFIDGVRLVYQLNPLSDQELRHYGDVVNLPKLLNLQSVKSNYGRPIEPMLLARCDDGTLELFNAVAGDHLRRVILQEIKISRLTKSKFKESYGDAKGKFNLSEKALVKKLEELELAKLVIIPSRGVMELTELGESLLTL